MLALESKSRDDVAALTKACVKYRMDDFLVNFFKTELARGTLGRQGGWCSTSCRMPSRWSAA